MRNGNGNEENGGKLLKGWKRMYDDDLVLWVELETDDLGVVIGHLVEVCKRRD